MAGDVRDPDAPEPVLDGSGLRIAIVVARFNSHVTLRLLGGARRRLSELGVADTDVTVTWVPGGVRDPPRRPDTRPRPRRRDLPGLRDPG